MLRCKLLSACGTPQDKQTLGEQLELYTFAYLERWSQSRVDENLTLDDHHALSETQEKAILACTENKQIHRQIETLQHLRKSGDLNALRINAEKYKKLLEQRIVNNHFAKDFKKFDDALFDYLKRAKSLALTQYTLAYLNKLVDKMVADNITDVARYKKLTSIDKAFLDLTQNSLEEILPDVIKEMMQPMRRTLLCTAVNCCATLRIEAKQLPHIRTLQEQRAFVEKTKQKINAQIQRYGNQGLTAFFNKSGYLNTAMSYPKTSESHIPIVTYNYN